VYFREACSRSILLKLIHQESMTFVWFHDPFSGFNYIMKVRWEFSKYIAGWVRTYDEDGKAAL